MKPAYSEIVRGDVSIFRGGAGGLSYVSRCPFNGPVGTGASWAIAPGKAINRIRKGKRRVCEAAEDLIGGGSGEGLNGWPRSKIYKSKPLNGPLPLIEDGKLVDNILSMFSSEIENQRWNALPSTR